MRWRAATALPASRIDSSPFCTQEQKLTYVDRRWRWVVTDRPVSPATVARTTVSFLWMKVRMPELGTRGGGDHMDQNISIGREGVWLLHRQTETAGRWGGRGQALGGEESEEQQTEKCPNVTFIYWRWSWWWGTDHRTEVVLYSPCESNTPLAIMWGKKSKMARVRWAHFSSV